MVEGTFALGALLVLGGCCLNNVFLEHLIRGDRGAGPLLTLLQFAFIAAMSAAPRLQRHPTRAQRGSRWWLLLPPLTACVQASCGSSLPPTRCGGTGC